MISVASILGKNARREDIIADNPCSNPEAFQTIPGTDGPVIHRYNDPNEYTTYPSYAPKTVLKKPPAVVDEIYDYLLDEEDE